MSTTSTTLPERATTIANDLEALKAQAVDLVTDEALDMVSNELIPLLVSAVRDRSLDAALSAQALLAWVVERMRMTPQKALEATLQLAAPTARTPPASDVDPTGDVEGPDDASEVLYTKSSDD